MKDLVCPSLEYGEVGQAFGVHPASRTEWCRPPWVSKWERSWHLWGRDRVTWWGLPVWRTHQTSDVQKSQWRPEGFWEFMMPRSAVFTHETPQMPQSGCHPSSFHSNDSLKWFTTQWVVSLYDPSYWFNTLERISKSCLNSESFLARKWTLFLYNMSEIL